jgi:HAD superfamily hydrolase (TIGR01509 family)
VTQLKALLWDVDGTLADTEEAHRAAFNQAFEEAGFHWQWDRETYRQLLRIAGGQERMEHYIRTFQGDHVGDPAEIVRGLHPLKTKIYNELLRAGKVAFRPGVLRLVKEAKAAGLIQAVVTTTTPANVRTLLEQGLDKIVKWGEWAAIVDGGDAQNKKPAPDAYLIALNRLKLAPTECLAIEDSENGAKSARAAGIPVLVTQNDYTVGDDFTGAVAVLDCFGGPKRHCRVLEGPDWGVKFVGVKELKKWHEAALTPATSP